MLFVWRGIGLVVPVLFFICGWIVSFFFKDTRLGNPSFIGWTFFYTGIACILPALAIAGMNMPSAAEVPGEEPQVKKAKKKHDFFFIPVFVWSLLFIALGIFILCSRGKSTDNTAAGMTKDSSAVAKTERVINFYNPSDDSLIYLVATENGLVDQDTVRPGHVKAISVSEGYYLLAGLTMDNKKAITLPDKKYAGDKTKYKIFKYEKGEFVQRFVKAGTPDENDYNETWLVLDGKQDLAFVDVTEACSKSVTKEQIKSTDWVSKIHSTYDAVELMEPEFKPAANKKIKVIDPDRYIPDTAEKGETVYLAVPIPAGTKADNETIARIVDESVDWE